MKFVLENKILILLKYKNLQDFQLLPRRFLHTKHFIKLVVKLFMAKILSLYTKSVKATIDTIYVLEEIQSKQLKFFLMKFQVEC